MKHLDIPYINYILDIIKNIENSVKNLSIKKFNKNQDSQDANIRRIEIIGESIKNISGDLKDKYHDVNWEKFEKIREILSNHYFGIDFDSVWKFIIKDIPVFKDKIKKIKKDIKDVKWEEKNR